MKQLSATQINILQILGDGGCHSGMELGMALGITRSAVWKQINQLILNGVSINRKANLGYQLPNQLILLDEKTIHHHLITQGMTKPVNIHLFTSLDSTNRYLKDLTSTPPSRPHAPTSQFLIPEFPNLSDELRNLATSTDPRDKPVGVDVKGQDFNESHAAIDLCCAEQQTQGRGRFGRHWHSPFGENIYCSSRWNLNCDLNKLSGLSLITSLAVLKTLNDLKLSPNIKVKWPNDILWKDKKLCGSLIEILAESNGQAQIIIGIGLNVNTDTLNHPLLDKPWCSLYELSNKFFNRNIIIASLLVNLETYLSKFILNGFDSFLDEWTNSDYLLGKKISVTQSLTTLSGIARGVSKAGQLILEDEKGTIHHLSSGDTTLQSN